MIDIINERWSNIHHHKYYICICVSTSKKNRIKVFIYSLREIKKDFDYVPLGEMKFIFES